MKRQGDLEGLVKVFLKGESRDATELLVASDTLTLMHVKAHQRLIYDGWPPREDRR